MTALAEYRQKVLQENPPIQIEMEDGEVVTLHSITTMNDAMLEKFRGMQDKLEKADESEDYVATKRVMVDLLAVVSDSPVSLRNALNKEGIGVLTAIYKDYTAAFSDDTKSENTPGSADES